VQAHSGCAAQVSTLCMCQPAAKLLSVGVTVCCLGLCDACVIVCAGEVVFACVSVCVCTGICMFISIFCFRVSLGYPLYVLNNISYLTNKRKGPTFVNNNLKQRQKSKPVCKGFKVQSYWLFLVEFENLDIRHRLSPSMPPN